MHSHITALEPAHTDDTLFREFIAERIIATQIDLLRLLAASGGVNSGIENKNGGVNSLEEQIPETIGKMPGLNTPAIATALDKSLRTTQRCLKTLCDVGKIEFRGAPKNGGYFLVVK